MKSFLLGLLMFTGVTMHADWLTPELLWQLGRVSEAQLSPDGSMAVYNVRRFDIAANKGNTDILLYEYASKTTRAIASDSSNETQPRWSSDGKRIYYLNDGNGSNQLYSMNTDGGDKTKVSNLAADINAYGISGNGKMIWIAQDVKLDKFNGREKYPDLPKTSGRVYDDLMMRHWDQWTDGSYSHILVAPLDNGKLSSTPVDIMKR